MLEAKIPGESKTFVSFVKVIAGHDMTAEATARISKLSFFGDCNLLLACRVSFALVWKVSQFIAHFTHFFMSLDESLHPCCRRALSQARALLVTSSRLGTKSCGSSGRAPVTQLESNCFTSLASCYHWDWRYWRLVEVKWVFWKGHQRLRKSLETVFPTLSLCKCECFFDSPYVFFFARYGLCSIGTGSAKWRS